MIERRCQFSPCRKWRYTLWRDLSMFGKGVCQFIGLNPSTADEVQNDRTITRCMDFADGWGYRELCMTNLFAWRDTNPAMMKKEAEPVGEDNIKWIQAVAAEADIIICAWGLDGAHMGQSFKVMRALITWNSKLHALDFSNSGVPKHPLYIVGTTKPKPLTERTP